MGAFNPGAAAGSGGTPSDTTKGTVDATSAANLPILRNQGDTYLVSIEGDFTPPAQINPRGQVCVPDDYLTWNAGTSKWDYSAGPLGVGLEDGTVDASLAANLPGSPADGDILRVTVGGDFQSPAIFPEGSHALPGDTVTWNPLIPAWQYRNVADVVSDEDYGVTWSTVAHIAPSKHAVRVVLKAMQDELDAIETAAGLGSDGTLDAFSATSYLSAAADLRAAVAQVRSVLTSGYGEIDAIEASVGLSADGTLAAFSATSHLSAATDLRTAVEQTRSVLTSGYGEIDAIETAVGLASDGTLSAFSGTNYLDGTTTVREALVALDAKIKSEAIKFALVFG